jgi:hypothetical protein
MTIDPAYASFTEDSLGSLERADYVVLSQDIMSIPINQILSTKVQAFTSLTTVLIQLSRSSPVTTFTALSLHPSKSN